LKPYAAWIQRASARISGLWRPKPSFLQAIGTKFERKWQAAQGQQEFYEIMLLTKQDHVSYSALKEGTAIHDSITLCLNSIPDHFHHDRFF
jgi:hypothetical protein